MKSTRTFTDPPNLVCRRYRAKIVPDAEPNADGKWIALPHDLDVGNSWVDHELAVDPYIPDGHHLVAVDQFYYDNSEIRVGNQAGYSPK